jgi:YVTN family beta-propeller protein
MIPMPRHLAIGAFVACVALGQLAHAAQAPYAATAPDIAISHRDRVYSAEQFSNTVSVIDPIDNRLLGQIRLGDPQPANFTPLYRGQLLVHGLGFSPDGKTLAVVSVGSNAVTFIETATNRILHTTYVGRSPHEAFFTPDGRQLWVTARGEDYVAVLDANTFQEIARVPTPNGPGMTIFSPDGHYAYVCSSFTPELVVFDIRTRTEVGRVPQPSPFCPNLAATPDGAQVWYTLKDIGKVVVIDAKPPFKTLVVLDTGPITNHVNFVDTARGHFAYVTVGGLNQVKVFRRGDFSLVATIPVGALPHGIWPSGDGTRVYVGLENADEMTAIDTATNTVIATIPIGQAAQAVVYVPNAAPNGAVGAGLEPLGLAGRAAHFTLAARGGSAASTTISLFDQGLVQVVQASVSGLKPSASYVLALAMTPDGAGPLQPLAAFRTNPAGAAIVNATGPIRQLVRPDSEAARRYLVIAPTSAGAIGLSVQVQAAE